MSVQYCFVFHDKVLERFSTTASIFVFTGFDTDGIISRIKHTIDN